MKFVDRWSFVLCRGNSKNTSFSIALSCFSFRFIFVSPYFWRLCFFQYRISYSVFVPPPGVLSAAAVAAGQFGRVSAVLCLGAVNGGVSPSPPQIATPSPILHPRRWRLPGPSVASVALCRPRVCRVPLYPPASNLPRNLAYITRYSYKKGKWQFTHIGFNVYNYLINITFY